MNAGTIEVDGIQSYAQGVIVRELFEIFDDGVGWAAPHAAHMLYGSWLPREVEEVIRYDDREFFDRARRLHR